MQTITKTAEFIAGRDRIDAVDIGAEQYAYYADETSQWYLIDAADICDLGRAVLAGERDAYSLWCSGCGTEVADTHHDVLDRIHDATDDTVTYRCQCGRATSVRCEWTGERDSLVLVYWVPESDRGSAQASGTYTRGAYAVRLYVTPECAEMLRYEYEDGDPTDREDPYVRVVEAEPTKYRCGCGVWMGDRCQWQGPLSEMVVVEYMPVWLRESHRAARNTGDYGVNGAVRVAVEQSCADRCVADPAEDGWAQVIGADPAEYAEAAD